MLVTVQEPRITFWPASPNGHLSEESAELRRLRREVTELSHKQEFGIEPICRVLRQAGVRIAPSTYYAAKARPVSPRAVRDAELREEILSVWRENYQVYGARKIWIGRHIPGPGMCSQRFEGGWHRRANLPDTEEHLTGLLESLRAQIAGAIEANRAQLLAYEATARPPGMR